MFCQSSKLFQFTVRVYKIFILYKYNINVCLFILLTNVSCNCNYKHNYKNVLYKLLLILSIDLIYDARGRSCKNLRAQKEALNSMHHTLFCLATSLSDEKMLQILDKESSGGREISILYSPENVCKVEKLWFVKKYDWAVAGLYRSHFR